MIYEYLFWARSKAREHTDMEIVLLINGLLRACITLNFAFSKLFLLESIYFNSNVVKSIQNCDFWRFFNHFLLKRLVLKLLLAVVCCFWSVPGAIDLGMLHGLNVLHATIYHFIERFSFIQESDHSKTMSEISLGLHLQMTEISRCPKVVPSNAILSAQIHKVFQGEPHCPTLYMWGTKNFGSISLFQSCMSRRKLNIIASNPCSPKMPKKLTKQPWKWFLSLWNEQPAERHKMSSNHFV